MGLKFTLTDYESDTLPIMHHTKVVLDSCLTDWKFDNLTTASHCLVYISAALETEDCNQVSSGKGI